MKISTSSGEQPVASLLQITIKPNAYNKKVELLVSELDERTKAIIQWLPFLVAENTLADIKGGAPGDVPNYPKMLQLRQLELRGVDSTVGIVAPGYSHSARLSAKDATVTLLFIKAVRRLNPDTGKRESSRVAKLLAKHSPWTMGTLPVELPRKIATMRALRVTEREVKKIEKMRVADLPGVVSSLKKWGVVLRDGGDKIKRRASRDIAFEVLRREFGIEAKHRAHWRPALRMARTAHVDTSLKKLLRWLTIPTERRWKKNLVVKKEQAGMAKRVKRFQSAVNKGS